MRYSNKMRDSRRIRPYIYALALIALAAACVTSMLLAFGKARSEAVEQLFAQERILATQAVVGISDYFDFYERSLRFLASLGEVADSTETGKNVLRGFFDEQAPGIASVSRVDEGGILTFTYPFEGNAGRSILSQEHVRRFLETRRITLSGVFPSVQGFPSIALYVPVYRRGIFAGGLAILIPFKEISSRFVRKISIGRSGYALLVDKDGTELYSPAPDRVGKRIEESPRAPNAYLETARSMAAGREGRASYSYPTDTGSLPFTWRGYYLPVRLEDASWSILVTAPEAEAVSSLVDFRNFWFLALLLLAASFCLWAALMAAALKRLGASNSSLTKVNGDLERALSDI